MKKLACIVVVMAAVCAYAADARQESVVEEFFRVAKVKEKYECAKRSWRTPSPADAGHDQRLTIRSELNYARRAATNCVKP